MTATKLLGARILIVEDEPNLGLTLSERLVREGATVQLARSLKEARAQWALLGGSADLVLLDVGLPDGSGFQFAESLRDHGGLAAPVVFLTAFDSPEDRIQGLEIGAEDYITKPFHMKELLLRLERVVGHARSLRGEHGSAGDQISIAGASFEVSSYRVIAQGVTTALTQKECLLLKLLWDRRGTVVSRDEILDQVWGQEEFPSARTVDNFIVRLRKALGSDVIRSVRGVGYQLEVSK